MFLKRVSLALDEQVDSQEDSQFSSICLVCEEEQEMPLAALSGPELKPETPPEPKHLASQEVPASQEMPLSDRKANKPFWAKGCQNPDCDDEGCNDLSNKENRAEIANALEVQQDFSEKVSKEYEGEALVPVEAKEKAAAICLQKAYLYWGQIALRKLYFVFLVMTTMYNL